MKKAFSALALLFLCTLSYGQSTVFQGNPNTRTQNKGYIGADSGLVLTPVADLGTGAFSGQIRQKSDFTLWNWTGSIWSQIAGGGGGGSADGNNYPTTLSYNTGTKVLTLGRSGLSSITASIPYGDTSGLSAKVKYTDTATMLSPYLRSVNAAGTYVPLTRTITINGTALDLSANRSWTISTGAGSPDSSIFATRYFTGQTYAALSHTQAWSTITTTPTTLAGYGITDGITSAGVAAAYATLSHTHTFASLTSKPTTLAGYGITDGITSAGVAAAYATLSHTHAATDINSGTFAAGRYGATTIPVSAINATGTASSSTYLRGDGSWATPAGGGGGGMSIGGAVTSGTAGSVPYIDGSGNLAQDNSNLFYDGTNHRLALGGTTGRRRITVYGTDFDGTYGGDYYGENSDAVGAAVTLKATSTGGHTISMISTGAGASGGAGQWALYDHTAGSYALRFKAAEFVTMTVSSTDAVGAGVNIKGSREYLLLSTNTGAGAGAGLFSIYDNTTGAYRMTFNSSGQVGVGTTSPTAGALLDVSSTTMGVLLPRMTTTQRNAISSPPEGLEIYNLTTHKKEVYDGTIWQACW